MCLCVWCREYEQPVGLGHLVILRPGVGVGWGYDVKAQGAMRFRRMTASCKVPIACFDIGVSLKVRVKKWLNIVSSVGLFNFFL